MNTWCYCMFKYFKYFLLLKMRNDLSLIAGAVLIIPLQKEILKVVQMNVRCMRKPSLATKRIFIKCSFPLKPPKAERSSIVVLNHVVIIEFGPLKDVLLTHNVRVDEQVAVTHTEVLLTGSALEALQMVDLVPHTHRHLKRPDPLLTRSAQSVLTEKPGHIQ